MDFLGNWIPWAGGAVVSGLFLTTLGAKIALKIVNRLPWDKIEKWFYWLGEAQSTVCRHKVGKKFYEPLEEFMNKKIQRCLNRYFDGTRSDNTNGGGNETKSKKATKTVS